MGAPLRGWRLRGPKLLLLWGAGGAFSSPSASRLRPLHPHPHPPSVLGRGGVPMCPRHVPLCAAKWRREPGQAVRCVSGARLRDGDRPGEGPTEGPAVPGPWAGSTGRIIRSGSRPGPEPLWLSLSSAKWVKVRDFNFSRASWGGRP